jgi:hypothetical protein
MDGWIKIHRQIRDNWIWKDPVKFQWWIDILMMVNHADAKVNIGFELYECKRGQSILSLKSWGERWGVSKDTVRNFFVLLSKDNMIICENLQKSTRLTVCNYDTYQSDLHAEQTQSKRKANAKQTQTHPNKNDKNEKEQINNEKEEREITLQQISKTILLNVSEIEDYLKADEPWKEIVCMQNQIQIAELDIKIRDFSELLKLRGDKDKTPSDAKSHFVNWYNSQKRNQNKSRSVKFENSNAIKQSITDDVERIAAEQMKLNN